MILDKNTARFYKAMLGDAGGDNYTVPRIDGVTGALMTVSMPHHEVHEGHFFGAHHTLTGKNDGTYLTIYMLTPDTGKAVHMWAQWASSGAAYFRIREFPVVTGNTGTTGSTFNRNRRSPILPSTVWDNTTARIQGAVMTDVTIANRTAATRGVNGGLVIHEEYSGIAKKHQGGGRDEEERVLEKNMAYVFEIESDAAGLVLNLQLGWYEHTNR